MGYLGKCEETSLDEAHEGLLKKVCIGAAINVLKDGSFDL